MFIGAKQRAKRKGIEFSLIKEDIIIPTHCPILGIELKTNQSRGLRPNSPSLDRRDNNKGYTKDNICVISGRANTLKSNASIEELESILRYMKSDAHSL